MKSFPFFLTGKKLFETTGFLQQLALARTSTGANHHFHNYVFNFLLHGRKVWEMVPEGEFRATPASTHFREQRDAGGLCTGNVAEFRECVVAEQRAGDIMFVPQHYGHAVLNVAPGIAVAYEFH